MEYGPYTRYENEAVPSGMGGKQRLLAQQDQEEHSQHGCAARKD